MASSAVVEKRRQDVAELWVRGLPTHRIALSLHTPERTIRDDIAHIRKRLAEERTAEMKAARDRSIAVFRKVQEQAWMLYNRLDDASSSKIGALNTISHAEACIVQVYENFVLDELMSMATEIKALLGEQGARITGGGATNGRYAAI